MAPSAVTTGRPFCNKGKEEARLIKEVPVTVGVGGFGEGPHPPPSSGGAWSSLLVLSVPQCPPQASALALRALPVLSPGRGARPCGGPCCCPCCSWRLCRLVSGWACPALPGTPGRGCGWVCVEGSPGVAGQASHPQQTEGVPQCGVSQPSTLLPAPRLERGSPRPEGQSYPPSHIPLQVRVPNGLGSPSVSLLVASESLPPSSRSLGTEKSRTSLWDEATKASLSP